MNNCSDNSDRLSKKSSRKHGRSFSSMLCCVALSCVSFNLQAQTGLEIKFVSERDAYIVGEPVILKLVGSNSSSTDIVFYGEDNFGFNGYRFKGLRETTNTVMTFGGYASGDGLVIDGKRLHCEPGSSVYEQIVLQRFLDLSKEGDYLLFCEFCTEVKPEGCQVFTKEDGSVKLHSKWTIISNQLRISILPFDESKVTNAVSRLAESLKSSDVEARKDAVKALGYFWGSDVVISNVMERLVGIPPDPDRRVRIEVQKAIDRLKKQVGTEELAVPALKERDEEEQPAIRRDKK